MPPPLPPKEVTLQLMQFIAEKAKNVTSPLKIKVLCKQFNEESGTSVSASTLNEKIHKNRSRIHKIDEFDMETKVKMLFALSAPIDKGFLIEMKKIANVEVDNQQRITKYRQNDGKLELNATYWRLTPNQSKERNKSILQLLAEKSKSVGTPMMDASFLREFKEKTGCTESMKALHDRYRRVKRTIYHLSEFDENTKIRMMFVSNAIISDDIFKKLRKDAIVELDEEQRIAKYEAKNGRLKLEGDHSRSAKLKASWANRNNARVVETATSSSSSVRRSERIKNGMCGERKKTRYPYSSSEESEGESPEEDEDDDEESMKNENDDPLDFDTSRVDNNGEDIDYDSPSYHQDSEDGIDYDIPIHNKENLKHVPTEPNSEVSNDEKEETGPSSSVKIETMSLLEFLNYLRVPTLQYTPTLVPKIDGKIKELEKKDQQISFNIIIDSLEMCIQILNTPDEMASDENTTSLSDFFYHLGMASLNIPHSSMDDFHVKMRKLATTGNKQIPMEQIRYAMKETLDKIIR